jgi:phosphatidate cytidylyltransferase
MYLHLWIPKRVLWTLGAIVALLVIASLIVAAMRRGDTSNRHAELAARVRSW